MIDLQSGLGICLFLRPSGGCDLLVDPFPREHSANVVGEKGARRAVEGVFRALVDRYLSETFDRKTVLQSRS